MKLMEMKSKTRKRMGKASKAEEGKGNDKEGRSKLRKGKEGIEDEINPRAKGQLKFQES